LINLTDSNQINKNFGMEIERSSRTATAKQVSLPNFKTNSGLMQKDDKIDVIFSNKEIDHLPSRNVKNLLSEF